MRKFSDASEELAQNGKDIDREHFTIGEVAYYVNGGFEFKCVDNSCDNGCPSCCFYRDSGEGCYGPYCQEGKVIFEKIS